MSQSQGHKLSFSYQGQGLRPFLVLSFQQISKPAFQTHMQTQQQILKYDSLGITDTKQLVFISIQEPGNLYYLLLLSFSSFRIPDTLTF